MNDAKPIAGLKPLLLLAFGAICISFAPVFVKLLGRDVLGPTAIAFWRTFFGAVILFFWLIVKNDKILLPPGLIKYTVIAGFVFYLDLFVWHRSIIFAGAGISTILGNTQVFWMSLVGYIIFKEKLSKIFLFAVVVAFSGVVFLAGYGSEVAFTSDYTKGIVFGLLTGIFYSSYLTSLKLAGHKQQQVSFLAVIAWTSLFCSIFCGTSMLIENEPYLPPDAYSWLVLIGLALVAQSVGWWVISHNLPKIPASRSGMVLLLQPTLATVWGASFFSEQFSLLQIFGAVLTITAIYFGTTRKNKSL